MKTINVDEEQNNLEPHSKHHGGEGGSFTMWPSLAKELIILATSVLVLLISASKHEVAIPLIDLCPQTSLWASLSNVHIPLATVLVQFSHILATTLILNPSTIGKVDPIYSSYFSLLVPMNTVLVSILATGVAAVEECEAVAPCLAQCLAAEEREYKISKQKKPPQEGNHVRK